MTAPRYRITVLAFDCAPFQLSHACFFACSFIFFVCLYFMDFFSYEKYLSLSFMRAVGGYTNFYGNREIGGKSLSPLLKLSTKSSKQFLVVVIFQGNELATPEFTSAKHFFCVSSLLSSIFIKSIECLCTNKKTF